MNISFLSTGGTISNQAGPSGACPKLDAAAIANLSVIKDAHIQIKTRDISRISSRSITPTHMWNIACAVQEEIDAGADGIIITHGTDTMEETVYALSLLVSKSIPIALTGAMRVSGSTGGDGPANVSAALAVATNPEFSAYGPVIVHQDEIHLARWVTKTHSTRIAAFSSPLSGPIGIVVEGRAIPVVGPLAFDKQMTCTIPPDKRVELITASSGSDGLIPDSIKNLVDGIVVAALGGGHLAPPLANSLTAAVAEGVPVILASRCPSPQVLCKTYGGIGSETHLLASGLISAGNLSPIKARIKLIFGLTAGIDPHKLFAR